MKKRGKSILRDRPGVLYLLGLALLGFIVAFVIEHAIHGAEKSVNVYVAAKTIPGDTVITAKEMKMVQISATVVPSGVIHNPQSIIGKYADATITKGEPILTASVAPASTVRELVRTYGMNYVGATVALEQSDVPVTDVHPGDIVDLAGVYGTQNQKVYTQWIAEGVPVLSVDTKNAKVVVAIPKTDGLALIRDLTVGKVRVFLDPRPFQGSVSFQSNASSAQTLPTTGSVNSTGSVGQTQSTKAIVSTNGHAAKTQNTLKGVQSSQQATVTLNK